METGIVKLAAKSASNANTTAEEMKAYVQGIAEKFCEVTGLSIIGVKDHERGATFLIGESGRENAIIAMSNVNNASYFYSTVSICRVAYGNSYWNSNNLTNGASVAYQINTNALFMKYVKSEECMTIGFAVGTSAPSVNITDVFMVVDKIICDDVEEAFAICRHNRSVYASYNELLGNTLSTQAIFSSPEISVPIVPSDQDGIIDIYLNNRTKLKHMKLYTNRANYSAWSVVIVNEERYLIVPTGQGYYSLAVKMG